MEKSTFRNSLSRGCKPPYSRVCYFGSLEKWILVFTILLIRGNSIIVHGRHHISNVIYMSLRLKCFRVYLLNLFIYDSRYDLTMSVSNWYDTFLTIVSRNNKGLRKNRCNSACISLFYIPHKWWNQPRSIHLNSFRCTPINLDHPDTHKHIPVYIPKGQWLF